MYKNRYKQKTPKSFDFGVLEVLWGEQDSNLRSSHSRFTVCPRWPLEYLPKMYESVKKNP